LEFKKAKNVHQVLKWCQPDAPMGMESLPLFYVSRGDDSPFQEIKNHILTEMDYPKLLFTGPKGCGKETELVKLMKDKQIRRNFYIKLIPEPPDDPIKLMITILKNIVEIGKTIHINDDLLKEIEQFITSSFGWEINTETIQTYKNGILDSKINNGPEPSETAIKTIRKKTGGPPPTEILKYVEKLVAKIWDKGFFKHKDVLILISNLDKISVQNGLKIFSETATLLSKLKCYIIFTFPLDLYYHKDFDSIRRNFSDIYFLANFNPIDSEHFRFNRDYKKMKEILTKRVDETVFDSINTMNEIIRYSGGVPFNLLSLVKHCALISSRRKAPRLWQFIPLKRKISADILNEIIERKKRLIDRTLTENEIEKLREVSSSEQPLKKETPEIQSLIALDLIIRYDREDNIWYDLDPIVKNFISDLDEEAEEE